MVLLIKNFVFFFIVEMRKNKIFGWFRIYKFFIVIEVILKEEYVRDIFEWKIKLLLWKWFIIKWL